MKNHLSGLKLLFFFFCIFSFVSPVLSEVKDNKAYRIVVTTGMIGDVVSAIVGDRGKVDVLIGSGVDPHLFKPTRSEIARLSQADIVFYNGLFLEGRMVDALKRIERAGRPVIAVTETLPKKLLLDPAEFSGHHDPHVWMDPVMWKEAAKVVCSEMSSFDSASDKYYQTGLKTYLKKLDALDAYVKKISSSISPDKRILITAHDAFGYFGRRYGFQVYGIQGISTVSEAGVNDLQRLVDVIVKKQVKSIFVETTVAKRNIRALIEGAEARGHLVKIGGTLFSDAMGANGTYQGTYIGMIDHNASTIVSSLGGNVPKRGMSGLLELP